MDSWTSQSNPARQTVLSLGCSVIGLTLVAVFRDFAGSGTNALGGFLLGLLLLLIGFSAFLVRGKQTIVVDPKARRIVIEDTNHFRTKKRLIAFSDIVDIHTGHLGKTSNYVNFYYLVLKLRSGEEYPLFAPGRFYDGGSDRSVVESRRERLEEYFKQ